MAYYKAHIVKPGSDSEYLYGAYFNGMGEPIAELFDKHKIHYGRETVQRKHKWAIPKTMLNAIIAILEKSPDEKDECLKFKPYTNQQVANVFKEWLVYAHRNDQGNGLVHVHWF